MDPQGRVYYLDHNSRTTSWDRPEVLPNGSVYSLCYVHAHACKVEPPLSIVLYVLHPDVRFTQMGASP